MSLRPLIWLVIGPNGAGKSTYFEREIAPRLALPYVNADRIAMERWPRAAEAHSREAATLAEARRSELIATGKSFATETVFSHPARLEILERAARAGFDRWVTWIDLKDHELAVARVTQRVSLGGHSIPKEKIRARYERMKSLAVDAVMSADRGFVVDNSSSVSPLRPVLAFERGTLTFRAAIQPAWASAAFASRISP